LEYLPHTDEDIARALQRIGVASLDALFADIPTALENPEIDLPEGLDEAALLAHLRSLAAANDSDSPTFLGGGVRRHFLPSVTSHLAMQSEFVTAYTPYQPEVSQGLLQATFEYQSMMCELTGLDVANASMYDGASAVAEAALLALRHTRRRRIVASRGVHPESLEVIRTYLQPLDVDIEVVDLDGLRTPVPALDDSVAALIVQQPNYLGYLEDVDALASAARDVGALTVAAVDPLSLALLRPPGDWGADIAVGDGQTVGNPLNFGGPHFGFMVVAERLLRQLPGRLVGQTTDVDGRRAFTLTLQAREQHIRRSKAKSNICSNHQLTALMAAINLAALGPQGVTEVATGSVRRAHQLADALTAAGVEVLRDAPFFNEFVVRLSRPAVAVRRDLQERGIRALVPVGRAFGLGHAATLATTELTSEADITALVSALSALGEARTEAEPHRG
jgi:glycine dehydrogenase subunit 1